LAGAFVVEEVILLDHLVELLKEMLHDNLEISLDIDNGRGLVEVYFDGDCICDCSFDLED
jgi:hypothetical protein